VKRNSEKIEASVETDGIVVDGRSQGGGVVVEDQDSFGWTVGQVGLADVNRRLALVNVAFAFPVLKVVVAEVTPS
jgi:hypothetical protein